jgi:putative transposase
MFQISRSTPVYYFTAVTHQRLPIFRTDVLKQVLCDAYAEARQTHGILFLAYVVMHDHVHLLVRHEQPMSDALRLINGIAARRVIQFLKENGYKSSLFKLRGGTKARNHKHSVWQHHTDSLEVYGEKTFLQKVEYIHLNPVRGGLVEMVEDYRFSSSRLWNGKASEDEPLVTDQQLIRWRGSAA